MIRAIVRPLRNLSRRRLRTTLTTGGIVIGIWTLVVFGALAARIDDLVAGGADYFAGKVVVSAGAIGRVANLPIGVDTATRISRLDGVAAAVPEIQLPLQTETSRGFSSQDFIAGQPSGAVPAGGLSLSYSAGRPLATQDEGQDVVILGSELARRAKVSLRAAEARRDLRFGQSR